MPTNQETPHEALTKMFSKEGYCHGAFCLKLEGYITIQIDETNEKFIIKFPENKPKAKIRKLVPMQTTVSGVRLGRTGGVLELDSFPDLPFRYDWIMEDEHQVISAASREVMKDIPSKFKKEKHRKLAKKILSLCEEWAYSKGSSDIRSMSEKQAKKSCKEYVDGRLTDEDVVGFSFIITVILGIILKLIIEWIIDRFIVNMQK